MKLISLLFAGTALMFSMAAADAPAAQAPRRQPAPWATGPGPKAPEPPAPRPGGRRFNRVIELWMKGQPVYYTSCNGCGYDDGKKMAATKADYISYDMESNPLDFSRLRQFMQELKDGGPTRSGHLSPPVIVSLPIPGTVEAMKANAWMIQQALAQGVYGILLCNAELPEAVKLMVEAARYPFDPPVKGLAQGWRGNGSQNTAASIWGMTPQEYFKVADVWPINPNGEIILGVKIENPRADANAAAVLGVPGISFAEHGPGDNGFYVMGVPGSGNNAADPRMMAIRKMVLDITRKNGQKFLSGCSETNVIDQIKDGAMICTGGDTPAADKGRAYTKRTDPW